MNKDYDVLVIGAGLAGLSAGSLLAKRGLKVGVIDPNYQPGGSCGIFKRKGRVFDQGSAMLYGFGESGFNAHRFLFNALEEPISMIKHDKLYTVNFKGERVHFYEDLDLFIQELLKVFPKEEENIRRFYKDLLVMYHHVMVENPSYTTADEMDRAHAMTCVKKHPLSYAKFLTFLNTSAKSLLKKYFKNEAIFNFFDKMTSTYCYATVEEAPAVLASVMFVDNHHGGSFYPAGSTLFLPGLLEKVIEEHGGEMLLEKEVVEILCEGQRATGVRLSNGEVLHCDSIIYSGNVWSLYEHLLPKDVTTVKRRMWARKLRPTHPSVMFYTVVKSDVIPEGTSAIEMLVGSPEKLDEDEVTAYLFSLDDKTLCEEGEEVVMAIGPSFRDWDVSKGEYKRMKEEETERLLRVLDKRFPGFREGLLYKELATPKTLERYAKKYRGSVAGPKQMLGQHMFKRLHTKTEVLNLYACGESTVMGTGTPTVTVSGIAAANRVLKDHGLMTFHYEKDMKNYVEVLDPPFTWDLLYKDEDEQVRNIRLEAMSCQFCERPLCSKKTNLDVRGIMRRVAVGNDEGARKLLDPYPTAEELKEAKEACILKHQRGQGLAISSVIEYLRRRSWPMWMS